MGEGVALLLVEADAACIGTRWADTMIKTLKNASTDANAAFRIIRSPSGVHNNEITLAVPKSFETGMFICFLHLPS